MPRSKLPRKVLCFIFYLYTWDSEKKHKDHIIRKYYYLFSFGDLLAIYFFIIHTLEFSIKKTNGILKLETQWFTFFLCVGKLDMLWLFFIRIHSFTSFIECLQLLIYKQTNKQKSTRDLFWIVGKIVQITFLTIILQLNFSILIFVDVVLNSFFCIVPSNITMCQILQLSLATLISNDYLKEQRK